MKPMKAYTNLLKARGNMALKRGIVGNHPVFAVIDPTSYCQLQCPACPTGLRLGIREKARMSWEMYKSVIDEVGDYLFRLDLCNWGEPFLHEQSPEFIHYAASKGIWVTVHSNLSMKLSDDYIQRLIKSGLENLVVALDGATQETYGKYRRGGDLETVRENMLRVQAAKRELGSSKPVVFWKFLVFEHNEHEVETARSRYREWGADELIISEPWMPRVEPYDQEFKPSTARQEAMHRQAEHPESAVKPRSTATCSWLYEGLVLNANGKISPCCGNEAEEDDFADYSAKEGFSRTWNSAPFVRARTFFARKGKARGREKTFEVRQTICERCPVGWWDRITEMPEREVTEATKDEARRLLLGKKDMRSLFYIALVLVAGGKPVRSYVMGGVVGRLKKRVPLGELGREKEKLNAPNR